MDQLDRQRPRAVLGQVAPSDLTASTACGVARAPGIAKLPADDDRDPLLLELPPA
jgi:hypothetical protein